MCKATFNYLTLEVELTLNLYLSYYIDEYKTNMHNCSVDQFHTRVPPAPSQVTCGLGPRPSKLYSVAWAGPDESINYLGQKRTDPD